MIDTSAVIAILMREPDAERLETVLVDSDGALISAGSLIEIQVFLFRKQAARLLDLLDAFLSQARIAVVPVTEEQARIAREAFRQFGRGSGHSANLNFGDCFPYGLAKERSLPLLFIGNDFGRTDISIA